MWFEKLSFRKRLMMLPVLAAVSFLPTLITGRLTIAHLDEIERGYVPALGLSRDLSEGMVAIQRTLRDAVEAEDADMLLEADAQRDAFLARIDSSSSIPTMDPLRTHTLRDKFSTYYALARSTSDRMRQHAHDPAVAADEAKMSVAYVETRALVEDSTTRQKAAMDHAIDSSQRAMGISWIVTAVMLLLSTGLSSVIARGIVNRTETTIRGSVRGLATAATEISAASRQLEEAAERQSGAITTASATMESLLLSATHISKSAQGVFENAQRSLETSGVTAKRITELSNHTNRMGEILDVIREIADKSDLLALNASLEGTRAGEAGRAFSLVATEMRRLAEKVTSSVQSVKGIVADVRSSNASTVAATDEARQLAEDTTSSAREITLVTQDQRTATEQASQSMLEVSAVLIQSIGAARRTRTAAENLQTQAERLNGLLGSAERAMAATE